MNRIVVDQSNLAKFGKFDQVVEFCDESGRVLGYFTPARGGFLREAADVPYSDEELDRFEREPGGRSLAEIMADLERQ